MSQENVEVMRVLYDHLNQTGTLNPADYAPDATFDASRLPGFGISRGFDEFYAAWLPYRDTFDDWWIEVDELLDGEGGRVFAAVRDGGRLKASGGEVRQRVFHVSELRGRQDRCLDGVLGPIRGPRSRRAAGVGVLDSQ